jgi:hypothetical protein
MKTFLLIISTIILMSFVDNKIVWHYPDFMIRYDSKVPEGALTCWEGYKNGIELSGEAQSYLFGIDSVAVKYRVITNGDPADYYTNFYARSGDHKWRKYSSDKKLIGTLTEHRKDTALFDDRFPKGVVVYYPVK